MVQQKKIKFRLSDFGDFLSKLSEKSDHVYWLSSPDFKKIQYISPAYEKIWGRSREELYENPRIWISFLHPDDSSQQHPIEEMAEKIARLGEAARFSVQYRIIRPDGEVRWIMDNGFPIYDSEGICCGVTGVAIDVTLEKLHELQLEKAKKAAEIANLAKSEFIANMGHDIRTPLSGIINLSEILEHNATTTEEKNYAQQIRNSGEQLLNLLNGVLDIITADATNENNVLKEAFNLREVIDEVLILERPAVEVKHLALEKHIDKDIPLLVIGDKIKLHRILLNLAGNAIKFTQKGHIAFTAKLLSLKHNTATIKFAVSDTGIGIPLELQDKVFDRFFKITPSHKSLHTGNGIGLHIAKKYVELMGGSLQLESTEGVGTTFFFTLKMKIATRTSDTTANDSLSKEKIETSPPPLRLPHKITSHQKQYALLIEDNTSALMTLKKMMESYGLNISTAEDGDFAWHLIQNQHFDLIITDIGLPKKSGIELTGLIRQYEQANQLIPSIIIGLSGHSYGEITEKCLNIGMNGVYQKPMRAEVLHSLLEQIGIEKTTTPTNTYPTNDEELPKKESELFEMEQFPLFDLNLALSVLENEELVHQVIQSLYESIHPDLVLIKKAHNEQDWETVKKLAHKMKSGALYGTVRLQYALLYLERYLKTGHLDYAEQLYLQLLEVIDETLNYLKKWLKERS